MKTKLTRPAAPPDIVGGWGDRDRRLALLAWVESVTVGPLTLLALLLLASFLAPAVVADADEVRDAQQLILAVVWFCFAAVLALKLAIAPDRLRYLRAHWLDAMLVALPMFHPLRAVHLVWFGLAGSAGLRGYAGLRQLRGQLGLGYTVGAAALVVVLAAALVTDAERGAPGATIRNFGDGLWWAAATVTTVGYGDVSPTTATGRAVGLALMVVGIATFGLVAANLASILLGIDGDDSRARLQAMERDLGEIRGLLAAREGEVVGVAGESISEDRPGLKAQATGTRPVRG